jgi:NodT family efflux transporter outer membrane factor (OMF) lipoprotein
MVTTFASKAMQDEARRPLGGLLLSGLLVTSACVVGPNYRAPPLSMLKAPARFNAASSTTARQPVDLARWWLAFSDPVLAQLITRALDANLDVDVAGSRLRQARAALAVARSGQLPSVDFSGSAARSIGQGGGDTTRIQAAFDAAYEVDLFGGVRRSVEAGRADSQVARANLHAVQLSVASEVAVNYIAATLALARLRIARDNLASQEETFQIVGWRVQAGLVSSLDLEQARQLRAQTAASIPTLDSDRVAAVNRLAVLVGEAPGAVTALIAPSSSIPTAPSALTAPVPADMIRRRPDVDAAERGLAAETARIGVQTAQLYPALSLAGSFGGSGSSLRQLADTSAGAVAANLIAPIYHAGRIRAAIEGQKAAAAAALATYRQTVLIALEEAENGLTAVSAAEQRSVQDGIAEAAARNAAGYARAQYQTGLIDFRSLLEAERSLLSTQDAKVTAAAGEAAAAVQLYKALGGGWQSAPRPGSVTSSTFAPRP